MTPDLLLAIIVDRVFMPGEVVAAAEDCVARLACRRIDLLAFVGTRLIVARHVIGSCLRVVLGGGRGWRGRCGGCARRGAVGFATVFLKLRRSVEASMAVRSRASV